MEHFRDILPKSSYITTMLLSQAMVGAKNIYDLIQPCGGLMTRGPLFRPEGDEPRVVTQTVQFGDIRRIWPHIVGDPQHTVSGAGTGLDDEQSLLPALGEGIERYCTSVYSKEQFVMASARELGKEALDLDTIPRCSRAELAHPRCRLVAPDKSASIRWVLGVSLLDGKQVFVPAVLVYLYPGFTCRAEQIWHPISTGCAAHVSLERALLNAILEVVERDAISIIWLQKLALPRIAIDSFPNVLASYWELYQRSTTELEYIFFDGTTDLGIPIVYGLHVARANPHVTTLVLCSANLSPAAAVAKVMRDMASCKIAVRGQQRIPESWDDFTSPSHGATYMARAEQAHAFEFLLESRRQVSLSQLTDMKCVDDKKELQRVLGLLRSKRLDVYSIELSTDEALRSGLRVVRVIIPGLQPLDFHYRSRYLGHSRLYDAPSHMGYPVHLEAQLNRWPQPFA